MRFVPFEFIDMQLISFKSVMNIVLPDCKSFHVFRALLLETLLGIAEWKIVEWRRYIFWKDNNKKQVIERLINF